MDNFKFWVRETGVSSCRGADLSIAFRTDIETPASTLLLKLSCSFESEAGRVDTVLRLAVVDRDDDRRRVRRGDRGAGLGAGVALGRVVLDDLGRFCRALGLADALLLVGVPRGRFGVTEVGVGDAALAIRVPVGALLAAVR